MDKTGLFPSLRHLNISENHISEVNVFLNYNINKLKIIINIFQNF